ncbi:3-oxoacyl-ACP reductase [Steroidobacter agaridevorans]|uniref:3-oxoacyl-ACP reductase n=1 Tax=Steroidobacter agaridevorans TaxID=2695856 RepID=A0A829YB09_9GAMM|nr:SDR family oxidoreductase [Steroidobacter agaridevorans]GFE79812.1 3-oxoacyl-ACP reductase [Steroidobacter agaridevorans]GFE90644.1 3-oxoacyl-ACP reductase [Steroidobacter agaridevorans]
MTKRFENKVVAITGAAGGMGLAFARHFAAEGAALILTDVDKAGLVETEAALTKEGARCSTHVVDLAVENEIHKFATEVASQHEGMDVLINNAGLAYGQVAFSFESLTQAQWLKLLSVNTVAPLLLAQALRAPLARAKGVVLNVSSMAANLPGTAYGVTKAALNAMTYGMASVFGADGIRVNAIAPGLMETPAARDNLPAETYQRIQSQQMLKVHGTADDIAALGVFLASDEARFITCEIISCDAGSRLRGWRG